MPNITNAAGYTSPHRQPGKTYVTDRGLEGLEQLGVTGQTMNMARRGDEVLGATSHGDRARVDGRLTLDELDRLDLPQTSQALFPPERAAVGSVHALFEVPAEVEPVRVPAFAGLRFHHEQIQTSPGVESLDIDTEVPAALRTSARRLQLIRNADADPDTLSRDDLTWGLTHASGLTASTLDDLQQLRSLAPDPTVETKIVCTLPATGTKPMFSEAGLEIDAHLEVQLRTSDSLGRIRVHPEIRERALRVSVPPGHKAFIKTTAQTHTRVSFFEKVVEGSEWVEPPGLEHGTELWVQLFDDTGALTLNKRLALGPINLGETTTDRHARNRPVTEWRDASGAMLDPASISGVVPHSEEWVFGSGRVHAPQA